MTNIICGVSDCIFNEDEICTAEGVQIEIELFDKFPSCVTFQYRWRADDE